MRQTLSCKYLYLVLATFIQPTMSAGRTNAAALTGGYPPFFPRNRRQLGRCRWVRRWHVQDDSNLDKHRTWDTWIRTLALRTALGSLHSPIHPVAEYYDERRGEREAGQCRPSLVRSRDTEPTARTDELTPYSIQEALRMYLQPIKNDDPKLDFYTMYKRETLEYDTEYMQKYNEDLNTTLIFVRFCLPTIIMRR